MAESGSSTGGNHPFRLEVQDVTPMSASILWSLRPPPLSAIPRNLLRRQKQSSPLHHQTTPSNASSASSSSHSSKTPANRLASDSAITATRSVNRKVTKVTMRNLSPSKRNRHPKQQQNQSQSIESEEWPSDDGATAVDEEEVRDEEDVDQERTLDDDSARVQPDEYSEGSDDGTGSAKIFDSGVSVSVNGVPWSQVVMGDRGAEEAFIVVYGLLPSREYELLLSVQGKPGAVAALSTASEKEDKLLGSSQATPSDSTRGAGSVAPPAQGVNRLRAHTPPMQDTDASPLEVPGDPLSAAVSSASTAAAMSTSAIQASIRRARKEASRAESALRNEIEAIKRGLERMSDVDHRSKQKVLALQESIRQATLHAKDIDGEAAAVEGERESWEEREQEQERELGRVRGQAEESVRLGDGKMKQDEEELEAVEKELHRATKALEERWATKERLEKESVAEVEQELQRVQMEIESLLRPSAVQQPYMPYYPASPMPGQNQTGSLFGPSSQVSNSRGAKGRGLPRGGNRSASNPTMSAPSRRNQNRPRAQGQGQGQPSAIDEPELHSPPSSSTHGSVLNPHNPEFVPSSASPVVQKSTTNGQNEYSPSTTSRFTFSPSSLYNMELHDQERRSSLGPMGPSPRNGTTPLPSSSTPWPSNAASGTSVWPTSSPTLNHDIWGAPMNSNAASTPPGPSHPALRTKTSVPFGLESSPLRGNSLHSPSLVPNASRAEEASRLSFLHVSHEDEGRGGSAPVSPRFATPP